MTICYKQQHDYRKEASWMKQMPVSSADLNITGKIIYILRLRKSVYSLIFKWNVLGEIQKYKINLLLSREIKSVIFRNSLLLFRISSGCIYHNPASFLSRNCKFGIQRTWWIKWRCFYLRFDNDFIIQAAFVLKKFKNTFFVDIVTDIGRRKTKISIL